jgi:hypothetical protein
VAFSPWITAEGYLDLLRVVLDLDLVDDVAPIQYGIRLLIPRSSKLLELRQVRELVGDFDERSLVYPWAHPDSRVDLLQERVMQVVQEGLRHEQSRRRIFQRVWALARELCEDSAHADVKVAALDRARPRVTIPFLTEPWYC